MKISINNAFSNPFSPDYIDDDDLDSSVFEGNSTREIYYQPFETRLKAEAICNTLKDSDSFKEVIEKTRALFRKNLNANKQVKNFGSFETYVERQGDLNWLLYEAIREAGLQNNEEVVVMLEVLDRELGISNRNFVGAVEKSTHQQFKDLFIKSAERLKHFAMTQMSIDLQAA